MALIQCKVCKKEMASGAPACPHCGKTYTTGVGKLLIGFIILVLVGLLLPLLMRR